MRLGIIADTHGLLRPEVFEVFAEVDHILHAGDIGDLDLLTELEGSRRSPRSTATATASISGVGFPRWSRPGSRGSTSC